MEIVYYPYCLFAIPSYIAFVYRRETTEIEFSPESLYEVVIQISTFYIGYHLLSTPCANVPYFFVQQQFLKLRYVVSVNERLAFSTVRKRMLNKMFRAQ